MQVIWLKTEARYFCERGWTGTLLICPSGVRRLWRCSSASNGRTSARTGYLLCTNSRDTLNAGILDPKWSSA
jgi:hypothetical protein